MTYYFSFDVESVGLYGFPFCFGYVIADQDGKIVEEGIHGFDYRKVDLQDPRYSHEYWWWDQGNWAWVEENVIPTLPCGWDSLSGLFDLVTRFMQVWLGAKKRYGQIQLVTDCPFPVESSFLRYAMDHVVPMSDRKRYSPYPVIDVGSALFSQGYDPTASYPRLEDELPAHNPLNDAKQSLRILLENLQPMKEPQA